METTAKVDIPVWVIIGFTITLVIVSVCALSIGAFIGFTARDPQIADARQAYKQLSIEMRMGKKVRTCGRDYKQEEWTRLPNADEKIAIGT